MDVDEFLDLRDLEIGPLQRPVLVVALAGFFDAASAATQSVEAFIGDDAVVVGAFDPDPFYDFTQQRPLVANVDGERRLSWPRNDVVVQRADPGGRDLVALLGIEPHLYWRSYVDGVGVVADRLRCEAVVTVGSSAEPIPHTRTPLVTGSTTDTELARRLGLGTPTYQGVTGVAGVLQTALDQRRAPSISLRVGVPHYLLNSEHPASAAALARHLSHVLDVPVRNDLTAEMASWRDVHDELVAADPQLGQYVRLLETEFDRRVESTIPTADDLGAAFEEFLRDQRDD